MTESVLPEHRPDAPALNREELERYAALALDVARTHGADQAEAGSSAESGLSVSVRHGRVDTLEHHQDRGLAVTVYFGRRKGSASTGDLTEPAVREAVEAACAIARFTEEDSCHGLADPELMATEWPDLDLDHPWGVDPDEATRLAVACEAAALEADERITNSEGATVGTQRSVRVYANSHGFSGTTSSTRHGMHCIAVAGRGDGMQRDYWYTTGRSAGDLEPPEAVGRRAAERTVRRLGARPVPTDRVPVLYDPQAARGLIGHLVGAVSGSKLYRRASFLVDTQGEQLFPDWVHLRERPLIPRGAASTPFDAEGVATAESDLVRGGVLQRYVLDSYSARRLGLPTTANAGGIHNLELTPGELDFDGLVREMGRGLVVTELMGQGMNALTGDYSRGASGFWVEDGAIAHPVEEVTVAGNLRDMFRNLRAAGADIDRRSNIRTGSILVDGVTVAGKERS